MTLGRKARTAEAHVGRAVDTLVSRLVGSTPRQPLEIVHAVLEDLERHVQPAGRGTWVFPFNRLTVELLASTREAKARLSGVIGTMDSFRDRIRAKLGPACKLGALDVRIKYRASRGANWTQADYHLDLEHVPETSAVVETTSPGAGSIELMVSSGAADRRRFVFGTDRIDIGRGSDVLDSRQRLLRRNQVAFAENGDAINQTVSRRHAHVVYRPTSRDYRVYDDGSARGTSIVRKGSTIPVPTGARGVALQSDDELVLGQARLRVKIGEIRSPAGGPSR
jgi:hypothetical protein